MTVMKTADSIELVGEMLDLRREFDAARARAQAKALHDSLIRDDGFDGRPGVRLTISRPEG